MKRVPRTLCRRERCLVHYGQAKNKSAKPLRSGINTNGSICVLVYRHAAYAYECTHSHISMHHINRHYLYHNKKVIVSTKKKTVNNLMRDVSHENRVTIAFAMQKLFICQLFLVLSFISLFLTVRIIFFLHRSFDWPVIAVAWKPSRVYIVWYSWDDCMRGIHLCFAFFESIGIEFYFHGIYLRFVFHCG